MKQRICILIMSAIALSFTTVQAADSRPSSTFDKPVPEPADVGNKSGIAFAKTSEYKKEFSDAVKDARKACEQYLKDNPKATNMAIVADVDETVLDNREHFEETSDFEWNAFVKWVEESKAPTLKPTAELLGWARKKGFAVFFVTGRPDYLRFPTIKNLIRNRIAYDGLYLRQDKDKRSAIEVKTEIRKQIEDMGFKIVVNIGDQVSDLVGGYAIDCEKLPNKLYFVD